MKWPICKEFNKVLVFYEMVSSGIFCKNDKQNPMIINKLVHSRCVCYLFPSRILRDAEICHCMPTAITTIRYLYFKLSEKWSKCLTLAYSNVDKTFRCSGYTGNSSLRMNSPSWVSTCILLQYFCYFPWAFSERLKNTKYIYSLLQMSDGISN